MLTRDEKRKILQIARESIAQGLARRAGDGGRGTRGTQPSRWEGALGKPGGAFVSLHIRGNLRGCIGYIESPFPVGRVVEEVAEKSAFDDPRFSPLSDREFPEIELEISLLSPLKKISDFEEIIVGTHGLLVEYGAARGLLLPQVATEYGWSREEFLENVGRKAGLPRTIWRDPKAVFYCFTAEIIKEEQQSGTE